MFCRSINLFICTFVAVAVATGYSGQESNTGSDSEVAVHQLRTDNLESSTSEAVQEARPNTAVDLGSESSNLHSSNTRQSGTTGSSAPAESGSSPYPATQPHSNYSGHQTPTTAAPTTFAQTNTHTDDSHISLLRSLSPEQKTRRLIEAAKQGLVGELEALLAAGADVGARDGDEWNATALHWAARKGRVEAARRLLAAGAALEARDRGRRTPLHWAAVGGRAAAVRLLLANNADHGARSWGGSTPLHLAAYWGHAEAAAALLEAGADREARDAWGHTPLDNARWYNRQQLVAMLQGHSGLTASTRPI